MGKGQKHHLKRLAAPKSWMLDKLGGVFAPRPLPGRYNIRECIPLLILLRNKLRYALTGKETLKIVKQRLVQVDGRIRTSPKFGTGFMDVMTIEKTGEHFRILYDTRGRFVIHRITPEEAKYKLCRVSKSYMSGSKIPKILTHDARTIRFPDPMIRRKDTVQVDLETGKVLDFIKFELGNLCMVTCGRNLGRVGTISRWEKHPGSYDIVYVQDSMGHYFATRAENVFVIGKGQKPYISLPKDQGVKISIAEARDKRLARKAARVQQQQAA